jgi:hypothetical protein
MGEVSVLMGGVCSFPRSPQLQQSSTEQPPLLVPGQDHHIERRDVHRDQLAEHTNLVSKDRWRELLEQCAINATGFLCDE